MNYSRLPTLLLLLAAGCSGGNGPMDVTVAGDSSTVPDASMNPDGATAPDTVVAPDVVMAVCGNGVMEPGEMCDDHNRTDGDGCDSTCRPTGCGSGVYTPPEICYTGGRDVRTGNSPQDVAIADFNGDRHLDVAASSLSGTVFLFFGDGTGALNPQPSLAAHGPTSEIAATDLNGDNRVDLVVLTGDTMTAGAVDVFIGDGSGGFAAPTTVATQVRPRGLAIGDFDGDTHPDLLLAAGNSNVLQQFYGDGTGALVAGPTLAMPQPYLVVAGDFDGDRRLDFLAASTSSTDLQLYLNPGGTRGMFSPARAIPMPALSGDIEAADFDGDGDLDLAVGLRGSMPALQLFANDGHAAFTMSATLPAGTNPTALASVDLDGDMILDLVHVDYASASYRIHRGQHPGIAFAAPVMSLATFPADFAYGDLNEDGRQDLVLASQGGSLKVSLFTP